MAQDYDTDPAFRPLGASTDTGTLFGQTIGLAVAPTVSYFADVYPEAVWEAGGATALFVAGFGAVLTFVSIPGGSVVYAVFGLAIFAGLVMYDFQRLRVTKDSAPLLAASVFLDILNILQFFLGLLGRRRR